MAHRSLGERGCSLPAATALLVASLAFTYAVSQFLRASVGVVAPNLVADLNLSAADLGLLSSTFFLVFALVQLPLGIALDRYGARRCLVACAGLTVMGVVVFAIAPNPFGLIAGRVMMGLGCSASLMAPLAIYARRYSRESFSSFAGFHMGLANLGSLAATAPLAFSTAHVGWRASFLIAAIFAFFSGVGVLLAARGPGTGAGDGARDETLRANLSGLLEVARVPSALRVFFMQLAAPSSFALVVGLWGGPYLAHIHHLDIEARGNILLLGAAGQVIGSFIWGPMDQWLRSHRTPVLIGAGLTATLLTVLAVVGTMPLPLTVAWFALFGLTSSFTPALIGHGRLLVPPHLVGRSLTFFNTAAMGGIFLAQFISGLLVEAVAGPGAVVYPLAAYQLVFGCHAAFMALALLTYFSARDPRAELA